MSEKKVFYYSVYGLNIKSYIEIKEFLLNDQENYDITFIIDSMPEEILKLKEEGKKSYYSNNKVWFSIDDVASYYITNGDTVIIKPYENVDSELLKVYLMCSCLGFIMLQRQQIAIHGGVINIDNKGVIFTGDRGAGKSTLTAALIKSGYSFLADDVAATYFDKVPYVYPGFPYQKLCEDVMEYMKYEKDKYSSLEGDLKTKYMIPVHNSFYHKPIRLEAICKLTVGEVDRVNIKEVKGAEKLNYIIKNIYREEFFPYIGGISPIYFKKSIEIARTIKLYVITRPKNGFTVNEQINLIQQTFSNNNIEEKVI